MISIRHILSGWQKRRVSSENVWRLDSTPSGAEERALFENPARLLEPDDRRRVIEDLDQLGDVRLKRDFAGYVKLLTIIWVVSLVLIILLQGFEKFDAIPALKGISFHLESNEFITVVTTTTASVLGLALIVGQYLFGGRNKPKTPVSGRRRAASTPSTDATPGDPEQPSQ